MVEVDTYLPPEAGKCCEDCYAGDVEAMKLAVSRNKPLPFFWAVFGAMDHDLKLPFLIEAAKKWSKCAEPASGLLPAPRDIALSYLEFCS